MFWRPGCNGNSFNSSCSFCWLHCQGSGVSWFNSMCVLAKGYCHCFGIWNLTGSYSLFGNRGCFSCVFLHWRQQIILFGCWSGAWVGVYIPHLGPSKTWTMMTVGSWMPTRWAPGEILLGHVGIQWVELGRRMGFQWNFWWFCGISIQCFFADCSLLVSHINLRLNIVQTSISWLASTCDAGHEFTDTFRLH